VLLGLTALASLWSPSPAESQEISTAPRDVIDIIEVNGVLDRVLVAFIEQQVVAAAERGSILVIIDLDSRGGVLSDADRNRLEIAIGNAEVPIAVWVGPNNGVAKGQALDLVRNSDFSGIAVGARYGQATEEADVLYGRTVSSAEAVEIGEVDVETETLGDFAVAIDGRTIDGTKFAITEVVEGVADTPRRQLTVDTRFIKPSLSARLLHSVATPFVAHVLLIVAIGLFIFEMYSGGVGIVAGVAAVCGVLAATGLVSSDARPLALLGIAVGAVAASADVQLGVPGPRTVLGIIVTTVSGFFLFPQFSSPLLVQVVLFVLSGVFFYLAMPVMVRTRYATNALPRDVFIGQKGRLVEAEPQSVLEIDGARWKARNLPPTKKGDLVQVNEADGDTLVVGQLEPTT
jgi:membrane-bound serine protease (ClpP class)